MNIKELHQLLLERNALETLPFLAVHEANATLINQVEALQLKCEALERRNAAIDFGVIGGFGGKGDTAALRNETRLREKVEKLQEELNEALRVKEKDTAQALETVNALAKAKEAQAILEQKLKTLALETIKKEKAISYLTQQLDDTKSTAHLAEQQYMGLKESIRSLQKENDVFKDENRKLIDRLVSDKEKTSDEVNSLNEMVDGLRKEVAMLRTLKLQDDKRRSWFGSPIMSVGSEATDPYLVDTKASSLAPKFGTVGTMAPSTIGTIISAHHGEAFCVRYDFSGGHRVATCGSDSLVKVWDTSSGALKAVLHGASVIIACDIDGDLAVGGGSDKMCRVWNLTTQRMIHQLVGHSSKITCVRLFGSGKAVLTGSADRSMKVWDISRHTYRQSTTLRHSSTCQCLDVASDSFTTITGHLDGGLRLWDVRTGDRTADIGGLHDGGITSVHFNPSNETQVLTNGRDHSLKLVDVRNLSVVTTFRHPDFQTNYSWSSCAVSPDGLYVASVSSTSGHLFVWHTGNDASLVAKLDAHTTSGAAGIAWGACGDQQVATVDRSGRLMLWT